MNDRKLNDFTPPQPPPPNRTGWRTFPITVDFPADDSQAQDNKNSDDGEKASES